MCNIAQSLLQSMCIDALNLSPMLPCELFNFTYPRVVAPLGKPDCHNPLGIPLEQHPHRMQAVDRLRTFQVRSTRDVFDEIQIDETLNRVHRCHDHSDVGASPQPSPSAATCPGMPVILHYVF